MSRRQGRGWAVVAALAWLMGTGTGFSEVQEIDGGWSPEVPYQFQTGGRSGEPKLTGLDIEIMKVVARAAGFRPRFREVSWEENVRAVREGRLDFALGATPVEVRKEWAWFSVPYRTETLALFVSRRVAGRLGRVEVREALEQVLREGGRVAAVRGYYLGPEVAELVERGAGGGQWVEVEGNEQLVELLVSGAVEGALGDRLAVASAAWQSEALGRMVMVPGVLYETPVSIMFSKATVSEARVRAFDAALEEMRRSGQLAMVTRHYLVPQLLLITMKTPWFVAFEVVGTIAFALSGVLIARREGYDVVGACVLAALPAVGGGVMRDVLTTREPIGIVQSPWLLFFVLGTVVVGTVGFLLRDWLVRGRRGGGEGEERFRWASSRGALEVFDAVGLATFTIIGVMVAVEQRCEPLWFWGPVLAAITAAGGGVLRDVLRSKADIPTLKGSIYPEIALFWAWIFSLVILQRGAELALREVLEVTMMVMVAIFATRLVVVHFGWQSVFLSWVPAVEVSRGKER